MSIGTRIKQAREKKGLTRNELAKIVDVTPSAISNYENEISSPKEPILYKLMEALECDANYLFQDDMKKSNYEPMEIDFDPLQDIDSSNRVVIMHKGNKAGQDVIELSKEDFEDVMKIWDMIKKTRNGENES